MCKTARFFVTPWLAGCTFTYHIHVHFKACTHFSCSTYAIAQLSGRARNWSALTLYECKWHESAKRIKQPTRELDIRTVCTYIRRPTCMSVRLAVTARGVSNSPAARQLEYVVCSSFSPSQAMHTVYVVRARLLLFTVVARPRLLAWLEINFYVDDAAPRRLCAVQYKSNHTIN